MHLLLLLLHGGMRCTGGVAAGGVHLLLLQNLGRGWLLLLGKARVRLLHSIAVRAGCGLLLLLLNVAVGAWLGLLLHSVGSLALPTPLHLHAVARAAARTA